MGQTIGKPWAKADAATQSEGQMMADRQAILVDPAIGGISATPVPQETAGAGAGLDWRKRMSDNIAYALLVYTGLQIFVTMNALKAEGGSLLPYLALIILVGAIIPACRGFERRWNRLSGAEAADPAFASAFTRDRLLLWALALGLPFVITGIFMGLSAVFT